MQSLVSVCDHFRCAFNCPTHESIQSSFNFLSTDKDLKETEEFFKVSLLHPSKPKDN